jgi:hypothetical protein
VYVKIILSKANKKKETLSQEKNFVFRFKIIKSWSPIAFMNPQLPARISIIATIPKHTNCRIANEIQANFTLGVFKPRKCEGKKSSIAFKIDKSIV